MPARSRPLGQPTRGKTAPNRLRRTDVFLAVAYPELVRHMAGLYVDLGYGFFPITSVVGWLEEDHWMAELARRADALVVTAGAT